jgi:probable F420-dependent oxidoreductase
MKFSLHFGNTNAPSGEAAKRLAIAAEQAGFESVIAVEHVVWPTSYASTYPYSPTGRLPGGPESKLPDPLIWFAYVGAVTTTLEFLTGILIVPQRNPLVLAKELATLDYMTGGRMNLGIGVGWLEEEFDALGVPFERRGQRTDEYIAAMRALWAGDDVSFHGEFVNFTGMSCNPKPVDGAVPIIVGGHSRAAARRAGRLGDGFFPATGAQVDVMPLIELARQSAAEAGRDPEALEITTGCPDALPGSGKDPLAAVAERAAAGINRIALPIPAFGPDLEAGIAAFGEEVIAAIDD